jgi:hypothetical protein
MLIAAHALSHGLGLVTDNVHEFQRVKGLKLETWRNRSLPHHVGTSFQPENGPTSSL